MIFHSKPQFEEMTASMAACYNVPTVGEPFSVSVPKALELINAVQESDDFLKRVKFIPVIDSTGDVVRLSISGPIASHTATTGSGERKPKQITGKDQRTYLVSQVESDYAIPYSEIDQWRRYSDYQARVATMVLRRMGLDKLLVGWYGSSCATTTNPETNTLLQDVNFGWLYDLYTNKAENWIHEPDVKTGSGESATTNPGKITIGGTGSTYANVDSAVFDLLSMIPKHIRTGREVVLIGNALVTAETSALFDLYGRKPTEKQAMQTLQKGFAGLEGVTPAGFPDYGLMVTDPQNLQIYIQEGSLRKAFKDNPRKNQVEHFQSENNCYRIGDLDAAAALDYNQVELA